MSPQATNTIQAVLDKSQVEGDERYVWDYSGHQLVTLVKSLHLREMLRRWGDERIWSERDPILRPHSFSNYNPVTIKINVLDPEGAAFLKPQP